MFIPVQHEDDIAEVAQLARTIWLPHFSPILGRNTAAHVVSTVQSIEAIRAHIEDGYAYWFVEDDVGGRLGYLACQPQPEEGALLLSKFYLLESARGRGLGRVMLCFVEAHARECGLGRITLTVHPGNTAAIAVYARMGFRHAGFIHRNIGGWEVDDVVMEKTLAEDGEDRARVEPGEGS
jgi:RimJ/RimL family protein N-acetyltransferase